MREIQIHSNKPQLAVVDIEGVNLRGVCGVEVEGFIEVADLPPGNAVLARFTQEILPKALDAVHVVPVNRASREVGKVDMKRWE